MSNKRIGELVQKVFEEASKKSSSEARSAKANQVVDELWEKHNRKISYKTVERSFKKYIDGKDEVELLADNVDLFCKYLGFENFIDYVKKYPRTTGGGNGGKPGKWKLIITIGIAFGAILTTAFFFKNQIFPSDNDSPVNNRTIDNLINQDDNQFIDNKCMTWADSIYVSVSCDKGPFSIHGTKVVPLDKIKLKNMRKVEVDAAYKFFSNANEPLIWYYKKSSREIEYFTAPGLHPTNGETLRKITTHIIETYVPIHTNNKDSFLE
nr:hypothetical protein [uncultured Allomuricauda sp.]